MCILSVTLHVLDICEEFLSPDVEHSSPQRPVCSTAISLLLNLFSLKV